MSETDDERQYCYKCCNCITTQSFSPRCHAVRDMVTAKPKKCVKVRGSLPKCPRYVESDGL